jgi:hypothetical protein
MQEIARGIGGVIDTIRRNTQTDAKMEKMRRDNHFFTVHYFRGDNLITGSFNPKAEMDQMGVYHMEIPDDNEFNEILETLTKQEISDLAANNHWQGSQILSTEVVANPYMRRGRTIIKPIPYIAVNVIRDASDDEYYNSSVGSIYNGWRALSGRKMQGSLQIPTSTFNPALLDIHIHSTGNSDRD